MGRRVFFSFHYQRDYWRVSQVRNSWLTQGSSNTFMDAADWEKVRMRGTRAVRKWIDQQLAGTSVTVVLIGKETSERTHVLYEIKKSFELGKGLLGIKIHNIKNEDGQVELWGGANPFAKIELEGTSFWEGLFPSTLADRVKTYDWVHDDGYSNIGSWIDEAARAVGR